MAKNKKRLFIILALLIGLLLVFSFLFYFYSSKPKNLINKSNPNQPINNINSKIELQNDLDNFKKAQENNSLDLCALVKDESSKNFCIQELALKAKATSSCLLISDQETQINCSAMIILDSAIASKDLSECQEIKQAMLIKTCVERIAENDKNADCNLIKDQELKNNCLSIVYYQKAKSAKDANICNQIPELIRRANCLSELKNIDLHSDVDKDGLDFLQEIANNTDPNNSDTDGDGYKDGDEFKNGFNPDGQGTLALIQTSSLIACKDIKERATQAACFSELKGKSLDITKCDEIKDVKLKEYCSSILIPSSPKK